MITFPVVWTKEGFTERANGYFTAVAGSFDGLVMINRDNIAMTKPIDDITGIRINFTVK